MSSGWGIRTTTNSAWHRQAACPHVTCINSFHPHGFRSLISILQGNEEIVPQRGSGTA